MVLVLQAEAQVVLQPAKLTPPTGQAYMNLPFEYYSKICPDNFSFIKT